MEIFLGDSSWLMIDSLKKLSTFNHQLPTNLLYLNKG
jgi:hypothetical protein